MTNVGTRPRAVFLAECYAPASGAREAADAARGVAAACAERRSAGPVVEYLGALVVPGDELAYHIFAAADAGAVAVVGEHAGLRVERVVPALAVGPAVRGAAARPTLAVSVEVDRPVGHAAGEIGP